MIRYLTHNEIDKEKWDAAIDQALNGIIYPYSFYLDQVAPRWEALVYNDYEAVMPLPHRTKWGVRYVFQPFFIQQLGVFSSKPMGADTVERFIDAIPIHFRFCQLNFNTYNTIGGGRNRSVRKRRNFELDLIAPYEQLYANYAENTRRNLKKAQKSGIFITINSDPDIIIQSFRNNRGKDIASFSEADYLTLKHLIYSGLHRGNATIYSAWDETNSFCAGIVFMQSHRKSILLFSGSMPQARQNGAMAALVDRFISDHAGENLTLDFEGSDQDSLARFYKGFGAKECSYYELTIHNFPLILKPITDLYLSWRRRSVRN
ncbi:MAG: hypothetical protein ACK4VN_12540 [Bacteroidales bacterium]